MEFFLVASPRIFSKVQPVHQFATSLFFGELSLPADPSLLQIFACIRRIADRCPTACPLSVSSLGVIVTYGSSQHAHPRNSENAQRCSPSLPYMVTFLNFINQVFPKPPCRGRFSPLKVWRPYIPFFPAAHGLVARRTLLPWTALHVRCWRLLFSGGERQSLSAAEGRFLSLFMEKDGAA